MGFWVEFVSGEKVQRTRVKKKKDFFVRESIIALGWIRTVSPPGLFEDMDIGESEYSKTHFK